MKFQFKHVMFVILALVLLPLLIRISAVFIVLAALTIGLYVIYKAAEYYYVKWLESQTKEK